VNQIEKKSEEFAKKNNRPIYEQVLHPRVKGFVFSVELLRDKLDAIYDIAIGYQKSIPQGEKDLMNGKFPEEVHFHCERIDIKDIPKEEKDLEKWCEDRWEKKEKLLKEFYATKKFPNLISSTAVKNDHYFLSAFIFATWFVLLGFCFYLLATSRFWFWYFIAGNIAMFIVTYAFDGMKSVEKKQYKKKKTSTKKE